MTGKNETPTMLVPHLRSTWGLDQQPDWWPVLGPTHEDVDHIGFEPAHRHIDYRYLTPRQEKAMNGSKGESVRLCHPVYMYPISWVEPMDTPCPPFKFAGHPFPRGGKRMPLDTLPHHQVPEDSYMRMMEKPRRLAFPPYPHGKVTWQQALEEAFVNRRLTAAMTCPHKGAELREIEPDSEGNITCPLHGLCWNAQTGGLVAKATSE